MTEARAATDNKSTTAATKVAGSVAVAEFALAVGLATAGRHAGVNGHRVRIVDSFSKPFGTNGIASF
jgi:hypothetical protein